MFVPITYGGSSNNETWCITLVYHDQSSSKQKLQVCKQQQTTSGSKTLRTMKLSTLGMNVNDDKPAPLGP